MHKRKKFLQILAIALLVLLASGAFWRWQTTPPRKPDPIPLGDYSYAIDYAEHRIERLMKQHHLPSTAVALIDDQNIIWQEALGLANIEQEIPATPDTVYKMYSIAKAFTAIETMRLVEEGLIDLDAPITDYLPEFSIQSRFPDSEPITVRSILAHHAGLPRNGCYSVGWYGKRDVLDELAASLQNCQMTFPVGYRYKYSNIGPDTLGAIIQEIRDEPFPYYMEDHLLSAIGMENSAFLTADLPAQNDIAMGYEYYQGDYYPYEQGDITTLPSGNLYATLKDMSTFAKFMFREGEANGMQIIEPETLQSMFVDQYPGQHYPQPMGLGWKTAHIFGDELLVWHDGGPVEGIGSLIALLPERKLGVVLFANEVSFEGNVSVLLAMEILEIMLETKYGIVPPEHNLPESVNVDPSLLGDYAGKYITWGEVMDVALSGDHLEGSVMGMKFDLIPVGEATFRVDHWLLRLGLTEFLPLPMDPRELEIDFLVGDKADEDVMIINIANIFYEICPRYPEVTVIPDLWSKLVGEYELVYRLPSGTIGSEIVGQSEIQIEDGVLKMAGFVGPLKPISETEIIILSGSFAGETMVYEPDTGNIYHQSIVYKPDEK